MYDHHVHIMWQQNERRLTAALERRRLNLEAVERSRVETEPHPAPKELVDVPAPTVQPSTQLASSAAR